MKCFISPDFGLHLPVNPTGHEYVLFGEMSLKSVAHFQEAMTQTEKQSDRVPNCQFTSQMTKMAKARPG